MARLASNLPLCRETIQRLVSIVGANFKDTLKLTTSLPHHFLPTLSLPLGRVMNEFALISCYFVWDRTKKISFTRFLVHKIV